MIAIEMTLCVGCTAELPSTVNNYSTFAFQVSALDARTIPIRRAQLFQVAYAVVRPLQIVIQVISSPRPNDGHIN